MIAYVFILLILFSIFRNKGPVENFCPDKLIYHNNSYYLWNDNIIWQKFLTYYDYLMFYNFMQSNYSMKKKYCEPLYPSLSKININNPMNKSWITNRNYRYNLRI